MMNQARHDGLRIAVIAFVTLAVAVSGSVSSVQIAAATSESKINLWAVPTNSCRDDGKLQFLRLHFTDKSGKALEKIKITLDGVKILEFDANGDVLFADPAFVSIDGFAKVKVVIGDPYYYSIIEKIKGKFKIGIDKTKLTFGDHKAVAEIFVKGMLTPTLSDDASFKLRDCEKLKPDLVAEAYVAPNNVKQGKMYHTFFLESNGGGSKAPAHKVKVYLSDDMLLDPTEDEVVGEKNTGPLHVNPIRLVHIKVMIPDDAETGTMFLIAWTDANKAVDEINEGNNIQIEEINVKEGENLDAHSEDDEDDEDEEELEEEHHEEDEDYKKKKNNGKHDD